MSGIQPSLAALFITNSMAQNERRLLTSFQRLSSGYRINSAADDPAGVAISDKLSAQIRSYSAAERNINVGVSMANTADGALGSISTSLIRMRELAVQASDGTLTTTDRTNIEVEFAALKEDISSVISSTQFNGKDLLAGATANVDIQVGIRGSAADTVTVVVGGLSLSGLSIDAATVTGATGSNASAALTSIDAGIEALGAARARFGATSNRLGTSLAFAQTARTNLMSAQSTIRDVNVAEESARLARYQMLATAGTSMLWTANRMPEGWLKLLS